ncbi:3-dehydroquinate synthase [Emcibacter nanhaiensis]|uniref:3-dehydroquinate synthase n=1 Tax=Emcibacter nanhaiensis TaxID=1505037 RepID=A0A501PMV4_9PROT|nr:3-dehydroquinate synthase [Emcibacter nanhaiensis]TPD61407.1 3-dehydroquinate synthase [Emcibacter nanhaiensis]
MNNPHPVETLRVDLGERSYDIVIGTGLLDRAADYIRPVLHRPRTMIVTDENVARHQLPRLEKSLRDGGIGFDTIVLPAGESSKSFARLEKLCEELLDKKLERKDMIIAFGGGVIGDLTGFAASILRRGMDFIQIPTTLLSQVDSSVGGKTGINTAHGKNLVGSFHQPRLVLTDVTTLDTLEPRQVLAGYAEVVKYGLIDDREFFLWLERNGRDLIAGDREKQIYAIKTSCAAKARVVAEDEKETGRRALLNLGHTFGHAVEAECGYSDSIFHGEAVAVGMAMAFDLSVKMGLCPAEDANRVSAHLTEVRLLARLTGFDHPVCKVKMTAEDLMKHMAQDKKVADGKLTFILARGIGKAFITQDVNPQQVREVLELSIY